MSYNAINLFSEIEKNKGFTENEIKTAEYRLGVTLPKDLRLFYKTQGKNIAFKTQTGIIEPQHLNLDKNGWLVFWAEDVGVCFWAINKNEFENNKQNIYIRHDGYEFEKEAENLSDFLVIRAAGDCSDYIYPYRIQGEQITNNDENKIELLLGEPKSDVSTTHHFHVKLFWKTSNFVVRTIKYSNNRGFKIVVYSKRKKEISDLKDLFPHINWIITENKISIMQKHIKRIENSELEKYNQNSDSINNFDHDLPF